MCVVTGFIIPRECLELALILALQKGSYRSILAQYSIHNMDPDLVGSIRYFSIKFWSTFSVSLVLDKVKQNI